MRFPRQPGSRRSHVAFLSAGASSSPPPPGLPGCTLPGLRHRVGAAALRSPLAAADSPRCHWVVNGVIYLFMSPDVSSPACGGGGGPRERRRGCRERCGCPGARATRLAGWGWGGGRGGVGWGWRGGGVGREWWRRTRASALGFAGAPPAAAGGTNCRPATHGGLSMLHMSRCRQFMTWVTPLQVLILTKRESQKSGRERSCSDQS